MDSTDSNIIQPGRTGPDRSATPSIFSGTVTGIKQEKGVQTLEVQYSQGKIHFQADGEFQAGEKVRISFPGGNTVQVAKGGAASPGDLQEAGYSLPQNLGSLRGFESSVAQWMANTETGTPSQTAAPGAASLPPSLAQMSLPELLVRVMEKAGGKEFLSASLGALDRNMLGTLMSALEAAKGDPASKSALLDLLRSMGRGSDAADAAKQAAALKNLDGYWPAESGSGASPWFGRILEKGDASSFNSPLNRLQYGNGAAPKNDALHRYLLDVGGRAMEVFSHDDLAKGDLADFTVEGRGGRMQAKFMDPADSMPAELRAEFNEASRTMRQAMQLSSHYLNEFKDEPYFGKLVKDFSEVLAQSGRLDPANARNGGGLPDQKELDGLMRLFVSFPRDAAHPEKQAKAWGDAVRNPQAMMDFLKTLRPNQDASLLRAGTGLQVSQSPFTAGAESPEALAGWLRKMLPEGFKPADLQRLAEENSLLASHSAKDQDPSKFLLQAVVNGLPKDDDLRQGKPGQFYFYQGQEWHGLQVTWEKGAREERRRKGGSKEPLTVRVETQAKHMGQVKVGVTLDAKGARIDFKNQFHDVRQLLTQSLPELEKSLDYLDFKVSSWTYDLLPEDMAPSATGGWIRPEGLSDGANLDLFG